jgi:hypothetical protein
VEYMCWLKICSSWNTEINFCVKFFQRKTSERIKPEALKRASTLLKSFISFSKIFWNAKNIKNEFRKFIGKLVKSCQIITNIIIWLMIVGLIATEFDSSKLGNMLDDWLAAILLLKFRAIAKLILNANVIFIAWNVLSLNYIRAIFSRRERLYITNS